MTSCNIASLPGKIHFYIPNHMAWDPLVPRDMLDIDQLDFKSNSNSLHFLTKGIHPQSVAIGLIQMLGILHTGRERNAKLIANTVVLIDSPFDNPVTLSENCGYPPIKCWLQVNLVSFGIFCHLYWVGFFESLQRQPGS